MGSQASDDSSAHPVDVVAAAFVERYYQILHDSPQLAHHFYQDNSVLGRPGADGTMTTATTMQGIGDKIMSLDYKDSLATIVTVYAQGSMMGGVIVGVTGFLTGKDNLKRNFSQTFFLAQQENGYFVLNDFLHFMDPNNLPAPLPSVEENASTAPLTQECGIETAYVVNLPVGNDTSSVIEASVKVSGQSETKNSSSVEQVAVSDQSEQTKKNSSVEQVAVSKASASKSQKTTDLASNAQDVKSQKTTDLASNAQDVKSQKTTDLTSNALEVQKSSYASILAKEKTVTSPVTAPVSTVRVAPNTNQQQPRASAPPSPSQKPPASAPQPRASGPPHPHQQQRASAPPNNQHPRGSASPNANQQVHASVAPRASAPPNEGAHQNSNGHAGATGIYIGGLPMDITYPQLKAVVEKFGPVKQDGIQIRKYEDGFTFGFVEFESSKSAQNAVEAHTTAFGEKEAYIDFKRSNVQGGGNRWRSPSGGGGYRNENFRNRERINGEDRPPNVNRGGYSSGQAAHPPRGYSSGQAPRGGSFGGRNGEGNRRVYQNGGGRAPSEGC